MIFRQSYAFYLVAARKSLVIFHFLLLEEYCLFLHRKERLKRQKIAKSSICFEFQVVVAVVGFKWHRRGNAKNAD